MTSAMAPTSMKMKPSEILKVAREVLGKYGWATSSTLDPLRRKLSDQYLLGDESIGYGLGGAINRAAGLAPTYLGEHTPYKQLLDSNVFRARDNYLLPVMTMTGLSSIPWTRADDQPGLSKDRAMGLLLASSHKAELAGE